MVYSRLLEIGLIEELINGRIFLSSFVGMGFKRYVDGLEELIIEVNLERLIGEKEFNLILMVLKVVVDNIIFVGWLLVIFFLMIKILFVKKFMKLLLVNVKGMVGLVEFWLFVSLVIVLKRNLGLFLFFLISDE